MGGNDSERMNNNNHVVDDEEDDEEKQQSSGAKCAKCGKKARKGCTLSVCVKCCTDFSDCQVHKEQREQATFRKQVKEGTTAIQLLAKEQRSKSLLLHKTDNRRSVFFREPGFAYMGDTVVIWNLREYFNNPKWKEDALRKSAKRRARSFDNKRKGLLGRGNSRKRFRRIVDELYAKNLTAASIITTTAAVSPSSS